MNSETRRFRKKDKIVSRQIAGEHFLVPVCGSPEEMQSVFILNEVAESIWQQLDGRRTLGEILAVIQREFSVEKEQVRSDLADFISRLQTEGLIEGVA